jgi:hypothetical protein
MFRLLLSVLVGLVLLVSAAQAQLYRVPGQAYLEHRPYQPLQPYTVPPPVVRPAPNPQHYLPRHLPCFSTWTRTATGAVVQTQCY